VAPVEADQETVVSVWDERKQMLTPDPFYDRPDPDLDAILARWRELEMSGWAGWMDDEGHEPIRRLYEDCQVLLNAALDQRDWAGRLLDSRRS
jgi:hypothetical protein